jgi:hypothetical protein
VRARANQSFIFTCIFSAADRSAGRRDRLRRLPAASRK